MDNKYMKKWFRAAGIRPIKTVAHTAIGTIGSTALQTQGNWAVVASAAPRAGGRPLLTSASGLPAVEG